MTLPHGGCPRLLMVPRKLFDIGVIVMNAQVPGGSEWPSTQPPATWYPALSEPWCSTWSEHDKKHKLISLWEWSYKFHLIPMLFAHLRKKKRKKELFLKTHQQPMKIHNTPPALLFAYLCGCVLYTQVKLHIPA